MNPIFRLGLSACLLLVGLSTTIRGAARPPAPLEWIYSEPVIYQENHDPSTVWLKDGRRLHVVYVEITWEQVEQWKPGRKLDLAYSTVRGPVLIDTQTRKQLPILDGLEKTHPLDKLLDRDLAHAMDTASMVGAYEDSYRHWNAEIDRLYQQVLESPYVPAEAKAEIKKTHAAWQSFSQQHLIAAGRIWLLPEGTMWFVRASEHSHGLARDYALRFSELLDAVYSSKPE